MDSATRPRKLDLTRHDWNPLDAYGNRQICLPMTLQEHQRFSDDGAWAREVIQRQLEQNPELFPDELVSTGFHLDGHERESKRLPGVRLRRLRLRRLRLRRLRLTDTNTVFTIRPSAVLPSMVGLTDDAGDGLLLRSHGVPPEVVAQVCGRNAMFWYRLVTRIGHFSLAGTTLRKRAELPKHLAADEYHSTINRQKIYTAVTAAWGVIVGLAVSPTADEAGLKEAYGQARSELRNLDPTYSPETVNTDGWKATRAAWSALFVGVALILCFLHGFLKIRDRCRRKYSELKTRVWDCYRAATAAEFRERLDSLRDWAADQDFPSTVQSGIDKLVSRGEDYVVSYSHAGCQRTSNMVDRLMNLLDRVVHSGRRFHGHLMSAEYRLRGWSLLLNFRPYSARHQSRSLATATSAAERVNQGVYHSHWAHNLYISASLGGCRTNQGVR